MSNRANDPATLLHRLRTQLDDSEASNHQLRQIETHLTQFRTLFEFAFDLLCIAGFDGYFKQLNPAWERTSGSPRTS